LGCHYAQETDSDYKRADDKYLCQDVETNVLFLLLVFVLMAGCKMQRDKVNSSESFCIMSMFVLKPEKSPQSTS
jgi:hypothetical protein